MQITQWITIQPGTEVIIVLQQYTFVKQTKWNAGKDAVCDILKIFMHLFMWC